MIALVAGGTLNSSAANFNTAVNGVFSGTESLKYLNVNKKMFQVETRFALHFERKF